MDISVDPEYNVKYIGSRVIVRLAGKLVYRNLEDLTREQLNELLEPLLEEQGRRRNEAMDKLPELMAIERKGEL